MHLQINSNELEILENISRELSVDPIESPDEFSKKAKELACKIPERIKKVLQKEGNEYILFSGIKAEESQVDTPLDNMQNKGSKTNMAKIQGILLSYISHLIGYEGEANGSLFQDIVPVKSQENMQISTNSNQELEVHTEQAFSRWKPDYISLACLRGARGAITYLLDVEEIKRNVSETDYRRLWEPLWMIGVDVSFLSKKKDISHLRGPLSILSGSIEEPCLVFDKDLMIGITEEANQLLNKIVEIYENFRLGYCLQEGDIIVINNDRMIHGRSSFSPKYDGKDRFLIRSFGVLDIEKSKDVRENGMILGEHS